jgi:hypothetical protein
MMFFLLKSIIISMKTLDNINEIFKGVNYDEITHEKLNKLKLIDKLLLSSGDIKSVSISVSKEHLKVYADDKVFKKGDDIVNHLKIVTHTTDLPFDSGVGEKNYYLLDVNGVQNIYHYLPTFYYWKSLLTPTFENIKNFIHLQGLSNEKVGGAFTLSSIHTPFSTKSLFSSINVQVRPNVSYLLFNNESLTELLICL